MKSSPGYGVFVNGRFRRCRGDRPVCSRRAEDRRYCTCHWWGSEEVRTARRHSLTFATRAELHPLLIAAGWTQAQARALTFVDRVPPKLQVIQGGRA